jgi:hypothetical protein
MLLDSGQTLLHWAAECNSVVAGEALFEAGGETLLILEDRMGANCLAVAATAGSEWAVRSLLRWCEDRQLVRQRLLLHK